MVERAVEQRNFGACFGSPLVAQVLLSVASCAVFIIVIMAAEWLARQWTPDYLVETRGLHVFSSSYGWAGRPGAVAPMGGGRVSLNRHGHRGRELDQPKVGERMRVVVLGDSVAFGFGVSDEQAFPQLLDTRDNGIEAGSLAVQGYGPGQELLVLMRDGLRADPDVVVLAVCLRNDFADAVLPVALYNGATPRPHFRLVGERLILDDTAMRRSAAVGVVQWLSDYSQLFNRVWSLVGPRPVPDEQGWQQRKQEALRDEDYAFRLTLALVMEMERICRERGIAFIVAAFPNGLSYEAEPQLHRRFQESLREAGVRVIDFRARLHALGLTPTEIALDKTGHLGVRGHAITAEVLESEIASRRRQQADREPEPSIVSSGHLDLPQRDREEGGQ